MCVEKLYNGRCLGLIKGESRLDTCIEVLGLAPITSETCSLISTFNPVVKTVLSERFTEILIIVLKPLIFIMPCIEYP